MNRQGAARPPTDWSQGSGPSRPTGYNSQVAPGNGIPHPVRPETCDL